MEITTCRNIVSYTATLLKLSFQSAKILSVTQPLFRGGNYNLLKYYQLHSHSDAVISICHNVGQLHSHSSKVEITTCQNIISYTATLPKLSFQSATMLVSCTATLLRWKLQPAEILSFTQPLFQGCNYNLLKCWSIAQPLPISPPHYQPTGGHLNLSCWPTH